MQSPVPALSHSLTALSKILKKAEAHCAEKSVAPSDLLEARLYPDMLNLIGNVINACDTAKFAAARLSETEAPAYEDNEATFDELQERIQKTLAFMASVPDAAFEGAEARIVTMQAGPKELTFPGAVYLSSFVTPNFYFHMAIAHGILRHKGVAIGKYDFLGA
jgi:hypothetical protein